jgi:Fe-S cluster assembly protein SufD
MSLKTEMMTLKEGQIQKKIMSTTTEKVTFKDRLVAMFAAESRSLFGADSSAIMEKRNAAIESFAKYGFPNKKNEEYKYTNIEAALKGDFTIANVSPRAITHNEIEPLKLIGGAALIVLVNGIYAPSLSSVSGLGTGITVDSLSNAFRSQRELVEEHFGAYAHVESDAMVALNSAFARDGVFIHIPKNTSLEVPVHILNIATAHEHILVQPRNLIIVEKGAKVTIIESFETVDLGAKAFTNSLTEMLIEENASVDNYRIQNECDNGLQLNTVEVCQKKGSYFSTNTVTLNGALVRNNLNIVLDDPNIESHLFGLYLLDGNQHVDNHTLVDHRKPHCNSNELYKGIIDGKATAVFNGKIFVRQDAQKTNAFQSNKNVLLSDDAAINTKPQLEIYADDVKCSHGTTTGRMDEEALFYLQSRGIGREGAKKLLMHAFANEVVEAIKLDELRERVAGLISARFS